MLPMLYRPVSNGSLIPHEFIPPTPLPATLAHWQQAAGWASIFWQRVAKHPRITAEFARIANDNQVRVDQLGQRVG